MKVEIQVALNFVISYLYNKLPRRRVNIFAEEMEKGLRKRFDGHWYPQKPFKGSGYRCLRVSGKTLDPVIETAAAASGLNMDEIRNNMPDELSIWIDPSEVSYRCGEKSAVKILYVEDKDETLNNLDQSITEVKSTFNPEADSFRPIDSVSSSLSSMSLSPTSPVPPSFTSPSPTSMFGNVSPAATAADSKPQVTFDAATFAQTKFGSTKMKTASKKINLQRLSPTEFTTYMKQRSALNGMYAQRPRSLSPNAKEFMYPQAKVDNMSVWGGDGLSLQPTNVGYETLPNTNNDATKALFDGLNFNVPYNGQYNQQSLVAAN